MPATDSHSLYMSRAIELARTAAEQGEVPVGALVVQHGKVLSEAWNLREANNDPCAHAELLAIREAAQKLGSWRLLQCTIYVTLEPCAMCAGAMVLARIERCVFGATDPRGGFLGTLGNLSRHPELNHHFDVVAGVEAESSAELLRTFFRDKRRVQ